MIILLIAAIVLEFAIIVALAWYAKQLVSKYLIDFETTFELLEEIREYEEHLNIVGKMNSYVGDTIIENLTKHTSAMAKYLEDFRKIYSPLPLYNEEEETNVAHDEEEEAE